MLRSAIASLILVLLLATVQGSHKKGMVHNGGDYMCGDFDAVEGGIDYVYNYGCNSDTFAPAEGDCPKTLSEYSIEYTPMIEKSVEDCAEIQPGDSPIMGHNEPNHINQANKTAAEVAAEWPELKNLANGRPLVCPSAAVCGGDNCITNSAEEWLDEFLNLCGPDCCQYIAVHSFICDADKVIQDIQKVCDKYGKQVWITEFACSQFTSPFLQQMFMAKILPKLEALDCVDRYYWYKARIPEGDYIPQAASLLKQDTTELSELGQMYVSYEGGDIPLPVPPEDLKPKANGGKSAQVKLTGVPDDEVLFVLQHIQENPCVWYKLTTPFSYKGKHLSEITRIFWLKATRKEQKDRIKDFVSKLVCASEQEIRNAEIWKEVQRVKALKFKKPKRKGGVFKIPSC